MRICVFCGSSSGKDPAYLDAAKTLGTALAQKEIGLVYGGAQVGLMGAVADAALGAGSEVIGVLPDHLARVEIAHPGLTDLKVVNSMHERKALMADLSDAFVALPGGIGTLEETFEAWTWSQLSLHQKPVGLLNINGFYDQLIQFCDHLVSEAFVKPVHRQILHTEPSPATLIEQLMSNQVPVDEKWVD